MLVRGILVVFGLRCQPIMSGCCMLFLLSLFHTTHSLSSLYWSLKIPEQFKTPTHDTTRTWTNSHVLDVQMLDVQAEKLIDLLLYILYVHKAKVSNKIKASLGINVMINIAVCKHSYKNFTLTVLVTLDPQVSDRLCNGACGHEVTDQLQHSTVPV